MRYLTERGVSVEIETLLSSSLLFRINCSIDSDDVNGSKEIIVYNYNKKLFDNKRLLTVRKGGAVSPPSDRFSLTTANRFAVRV